MNINKCWVIVDRVIAVVQFAVLNNIIKTAQDGNLNDFKDYC